MPFEKPNTKSVEVKELIHIRELAQEAMHEIATVGNPTKEEVAVRLFVAGRMTLIEYSIDEALGMHRERHEAMD